MRRDIDLKPYEEVFTNFYNSALQEQLSTLSVAATPVLNIDFLKLQEFNKDVSELLVYSPDSIITASENALHSLLNKKSDYSEAYVKFFNIPLPIIKIQDIRAEHKDRLIAINGYVTKCSAPKLKARVATYVCQMCDASVRILVTKDASTHLLCDFCKRRALRLDDENVIFTNFQEAELAESPKPSKKQFSTIVRIPIHIEGAFTPFSMNEEVKITGILRLKVTKLEAPAERYIEVVSADKLSK